MTPTRRVSSAPSEWISKSERLSWMGKLSNFKFGILQDRRDFALLLPATTEELMGSSLYMM
ncbi:hypothetical protein DNTS_022829 [Danionella cerebrum]|uniref:Uncharacterized protein n=1 Tax=Danionella cerebrum TaxID=2873325 RepID=A0A553RAR9_9TELE|nr:hypothetical protein DNTS_022829 [Danionella translucida]